MTVSSTPRRAGPFLGNDVTASFPFTFKVFSAAEVQVTLKNAAGVESVLTSGFTVTLNADQDNEPGGSVGYPLATGECLTITGDLPAEQQIDLTNLSRRKTQAIENGLDYLTVLVQQQAERQKRALSAPVNDPDPLGALPGQDARKGRVLAFDSTTGAPVEGPTIAAVGAVADASAAVQTVATNISSVNTAAANMQAIVAAPTQAAAAAASASAANASRQAIDARIYPGTYAADPLTRPDGSAIQNGDIYFTTASVPKVFGSGVWAQVPSASAADLANSTDPARGTALVGHRNVSLRSKLDDVSAKVGKTRAIGWRRRLTSMEAPMFLQSRAPTLLAQQKLPFQSELRAPRQRISTLTRQDISSQRYAIAVCPVPHNLVTGDKVVMFGAQDAYVLASQQVNPPNYAQIPTWVTRGTAVEVVDELTFRWPISNSAFPTTPDPSTLITWERSPTFWNPSDPVFHYPGGRSLLRRGANNNFYNGLDAAIMPVFGGSVSRQLYAVEFWCDDPEFEVATSGGGIRVYVDGQPFHSFVDTATPSWPGFITRVTFNGRRASRLVRLEITGRFHGVITPSPGGIQRAIDAPKRPRMLLIGDSFGEGTGTTHWWYSCGYLLAQAMGWEMVNASLGSTGLTTAGVHAGFAYGDRAKLWQAAGADPEIICIIDSVNDAGNVTVSNATAFVTSLRTLWPAAQIVVLGRVSPSENANAGATASTQNWRTVCDNEGLIYCDGGIGAFGGPIAITAGNKATYYTGTAAAATAAVSGGAVTGATVTNNGAGYDPHADWIAGTKPAVTVSGGGGSGAVLTPVMNYQVSDVFVLRQGRGYTSATVALSHGASAVSTISGGALDSISVTAPGGNFIAAPTITITGGGGSGATAVAEIEGGRLARIIITNAGSGYTSAPAVNIAISSTDATATATITGGRITGVTITNAGSFFTSVPLVTVTGDGEGAELVAFVSGRVESLTVANGGSGYSTAPTVTIAHPTNNDVTHPKNNGHQLIASLWAASLEAA